MREERVSFYSWGHKLSGVLKLPDSKPGNPPAVILEGAGWASLMSHPNTEQYHRGFVAAGYAVFVFDYRGFGESEGDRGWIRPQDQVEDMLCAVTYLETREDVDGNRIGVFGMGGTGGGNAIYAAAADERIKCVGVQTVVADGAAWLHGMRREYEWVAFLERVKANRRRRVLENVDEMVDPREELMVASPERKADVIRPAWDKRAGATFHFGSAEALWHYRPIDVVHRIAPRALLITSIENDVVTPEWHAEALYAKAGRPKKLVRQTGVKHYQAYAQNYDVLLSQFVDWYDRYLVHSAISARELHAEEEITRL